MLAGQELIKEPLAIGGKIPGLIGVTVNRSVHAVSPNTCVNIDATIMSELRRNTPKLYKHHFVCKPKTMSV